MQDQAPLDPLSHVFEHLELRAGGLAQLVVLNTPWGIAMPAAFREFLMYSIRKGSCVLEWAGGNPIELQAGDAALVSRNTPHLLHDGSRTLRPLSWWTCSEKNTAVRDANSPGQVWLICESFKLSGMLGCSFAAALGDRVVLRATPGEESRHQHLFSALCRESTSPRPGQSFVYSRLMELFFVEFLRDCILRDWNTERPNLLRVLFDAQILKAIQQVKQHPEQPWTVASLARVAGMSRTAFATRFSSLSGMTPLAYVTRWRMSVAERLLAQGHTLAETADRVGYDSEAAFSRAFKRLTGASPGSKRPRTKP